VAERVGEHFGAFQDQECRQIKDSLVAMEQSGTGRVLLADFYKPALGGNWQFQETVAYLRELGALDESDPERPRVIIPNYMASPSNCIASSSFYSVCCMDECEGLLGHLEQRLAKPEASSTEIASLVAQLSSSSVLAPRTLPSALLGRLGEIAAQHGGTVPLHGRLFAQWMHHAFPRECPFPHLSGTTNPQTPDEWLEATGEETTATHEEMQVHVAKASETQDSKASSAVATEEDDMHSLPWSPEEELLIVRQAPEQLSVQKTSCSSLRNLMMFAAVASGAYSLVRTSKASVASVGAAGAEKFLV